MKEGKNLGGRPRIYDSPKAFDAKVDEYVAHCTNEGTLEPVTWTGLALYLGFCSRASIDEYAKYDGFSYSVKRAKAIVEHFYEMRLCGDKPTGAIFALKNFGWHDKKETEHSGTIGISHEDALKELD
jgi:hypothetical protein